MTIRDFAELMGYSCRNDHCAFVDCPLGIDREECDNIQTEDWLEFLITLDKGEIKTAHYCGNCKHLNGAGGPYTASENKAWEKWNEQKSLDEKDAMIDWLAEKLATYFDEESVSFPERKEYWRKAAKEAVK